MLQLSDLELYPGSVSCRSVSDFFSCCRSVTVLQLTVPKPLRVQVDSLMQGVDLYRSIVSCSISVCLRRQYYSTITERIGGGLR